MPREKLSVTIRIYEESELELPGVTLGVLRLTSEKTLDAIGDPIDVLMRVSEEQARAKKGSYVEVIVAGSDATYVMGEAPRYRWRRKLTMRPERLLRVGIVRQGIIGGSEKGLQRFRLEDIEWHDVPEGTYVFEGKLEADEDVILIVLETETSRSYVRPSRLPRRSSQSRG